MGRAFFSPDKSSDMNFFNGEIFIAFIILSQKKLTDVSIKQFALQEITFRIRDSRRTNSIDYAYYIKAKKYHPQENIYICE